MKQKIEIGWERVYKEKVIGGCFAGGIFNDNESQRSYTSGYKDGFEQAKINSIPFISDLLASERDEGYAEGLQEFAKMQDKVIKQAVARAVASERQRCVEATAKGIISMCEMTDDEMERIEEEYGFKIDQAKRNLEQMK